MNKYVNTIHGHKNDHYVPLAFCLLISWAKVMRRIANQQAYKSTCLNEIRILKSIVIYDTMKLLLDNNVQRELLSSQQLFI